MFEISVYKIWNLNSLNLRFKLIQFEFLIYQIWNFIISIHDSSLLQLLFLFKSSRGTPSVLQYASKLETLIAQHLHAVPNQRMSDQLFNLKRRLCGVRFRFEFASSTKLLQFGNYSSSASKQTTKMRKLFPVNAGNLQSSSSDISIQNRDWTTPENEDKCCRSVIWDFQWRFNLNRIPAFHATYWQVRWDT